MFKELKKSVGKSISAFDKMVERIDTLVEENAKLKRLAVSTILESRI